MQSLDPALSRPMFWSSCCTACRRHHSCNALADCALAWCRQACADACHAQAACLGWERRAVIAESCLLLDCSGFGHPQLAYTRHLSSALSYTLGSSVVPSRFMQHGCGECCNVSKPSKYMAVVECCNVYKAHMHVRAHRLQDAVSWVACVAQRCIVLLWLLTW